MLLAPTAGAHTICSTHRCIQMAEFIAHPNYKAQALSISSFTLAQRVPQQGKTLLNASFPLVDACFATFTRACICLLLCNCILFAFALNGALQHVQRLHRGCPSSSTSFLVAKSSFKVIYNVGLFAILPTSLLGWFCKP